MKIVLLSKTEDEEKSGGPYKWAKNLEEGMKDQQIDFSVFRSNWKSLFNGKIFKGFSKIHENEIVHTYVSNIGILLLTLYAKLIGKKIIYTCRGNFFEEWKGKSR